MRCESGDVQKETFVQIKKYKTALIGSINPPEIPELLKINIHDTKLETFFIRNK